MKIIDLNKEQIKQLEEALEAYDEKHITYYRNDEDDYEEYFFIKRI